MIRDLVKDQDGAVALMTLVFMLLVGAVSILFLWSLAYITGAYNTLYIANQNAAIAASTTPGEVTDTLSGQLAYQCDLAGTVCESDSSTVVPVVKAASLVMDRSLSRKPFGLDFQGADRNVLLLNPQWTYNGNDPKSQSFESFQSDSDFVEVFNVQRSPGEIKAILNSTFTGPSGEVLRPECKIKTGKFHGGIAQEFSGDPEGTVHCWQVKESGIEFPAQYTSGVMTRSLAQIGLIPGCQLDFCQTTILVTAAAAQQQLAGPSDYQDYLRP